MLNENLKTLRKNRGLSQEELSVKLNVVRQTISKWEQGLSVPDAEMLIAISKEFEIPVSELLGEHIPENKLDDMKAISEKLEIINLQLLKRNNTKRKMFFWISTIVCSVIIVAWMGLILFGSPYLSWDYSNSETAVLGVGFHIFEWLFVRLSPFILVIAIFGIVLSRKKQD